MDGKTAARFYRLYRYWMAGRISTSAYAWLLTSLRAQQKTWRNN